MMMESLLYQCAAQFIRIEYCIKTKRNKRESYNYNKIQLFDKIFKLTKKQTKKKKNIPLIVYRLQFINNISIVL